MVVDDSLQRNVIGWHEHLDSCIVHEPRIGPDCDDRATGMAITADPECIDQTMVIITGHGR